MIHTGDCIEVMRGMPADSVDAVVTDPPYGLEFMGREWDRLGRRQNHPLDPSKEIAKDSSAEPRAKDNPWQKEASGYGAPQKNARCKKCYRLQFGHEKFRCNCKEPDWNVRNDEYGYAMQWWHEAWGREALRVTKPGGYLLAFGGTRTHHRLVCGLEDAGWIIRDELTWVYACLSDDSEILTRRGWLRYNEVSTNDDALAFDSDTGTLRWEPVEAVHQYHHEGDMVRLHGAGTDQLVTLNHRLVFVDGQGMAPMPGVRQRVLAALRPPSTVQGPGLLDSLQRNAAYPRSTVPAGAVMERRAEGASIAGDAWPSELGLEGRRYRVQEAWELLGRAVRSDAGLGEADGSQGWLHHGAPPTDGGYVRLPDDQGRSGEPRESRPDRQPPRESNAVALEPGPQAVRVEPAGDGWRLVPTAATAELVDYAGVVWCVTVPSGAFVARRNGLAFVTGNSGFPKGRANLKPAHEPIVLARKPGPLRPLGIDECRIPTGSEQPRGSGRPNYGLVGFSGETGNDGNETPDLGRWPSNLLLSDPELFDEPNPYVVGSGAVVNTQANRADYSGERSLFGGTLKGGHGPQYGDTGGYSRFFIVPKSSRADREPVVRGENALQADVAGIGALRDGGRPSVPRENAHPTVKPTDLMRHLVRLVTPSGGTVLDPFLGSGSTALACELEGFSWIGIEQSAEYVAIAEARLNGTQRGLGLDVGAPTRKRTKAGPDKGGGTRCSDFPAPCSGHPGHGKYGPTIHVRSNAEPAA